MPGPNGSCGAVTRAPIDTAFRLPRSNDDVEARRQAAIIGCYQGCHGKVGQGQTMVAPGIHRITAPSLTEVLSTYSDGELVRLLRYGVRRDGTTALLMPADTFYAMSDAHIGQIVDFIRRQPTVAGPARVRALSLKARLGILLGRYPLSVVGVNASAPRWGARPRVTAFERGRYTASTVCADCHGPNVEGDPIDGGPSLRIIGAYDLPAFRHLLRTGEPVGGPRDIGLMGEVAREVFVQFREDDRRPLRVPA